MEYVTGFAGAVAPRLLQFITYFNKSVSEDESGFIENGKGIIAAYAKDSKPKAVDVQAAFDYAIAPVAALSVTCLSVSLVTYLLSNYTPFFSSVFRVVSYALAFFAGNLFMVYMNLYTERNALEARVRDQEDPGVSKVAFFNHVNICVGKILAATPMLWLVPQYRVEVSKIEQMIQTLIENAKKEEGQKDTQTIISEQIPNLFKLVSVSAKYLNPKEK